MNHRIIGKLLSLLLLILGLCQLPALACGWWYGEMEALCSFALSMTLTLALGGAGAWTFRGAPQELYRREAMTVVGLGWFLATFTGALPYVFFGLRHPDAEFSELINCLYESASGFTTTGSTILTDIEKYPRAILLWRSLTHWLGGLGIVVLFVAVLPQVGAIAKQLFRSEVGGPVKDGLKPRIQDSAMILLYIYLLFTVAETILLITFGMDFFDAFCHTCATLSTGGFSTKNASVAYYLQTPGYNGLGIEWTIVAFMYLCGVSFSLHFILLRQRDWRKVFADSEWQCFTGLFLVSVFVFTILVYNSGLEGGLFASFRASLFQVCAISTCTGFVTADFDRWPDFCRYWLVLLMIMGGCAGSTAGGIKVVRAAILFKILADHLRHMVQPRIVRKVRFNGVTINDDLRNNVLMFTLLFLLVVMGASLALALRGYDIATSTSAVLANISNVGPGLARVGAVQNYYFFDPFSKLLLTLVMISGRLELYSVLVMLNPEFWRNR
ncbi:TrkH family potassium uptake protein [Candidatus Sumerlaeota bacterium]|nr:TrkH family potassium uptake protein [Candidatus Sumerlaeota bacterium]